MLSFNGVSISGIPVRKVLFSDFVLGFGIMILFFYVIIPPTHGEDGKRGSSVFPVTAFPLLASTGQVKSSA